jgi:hypothetical protein
VSPGWLEPLLDPFLKNMNTLVFPDVGAINLDNFRSSLSVSNQGPFNCGTFKWTMDYDWANVKDFNAINNTNKWAPQKSIAAIG